MLVEMMKAETDGTLNFRFLTQSNQTNEFSKSLTGMGHPSSGRFVPLDHFLLSNRDMHSTFPTLTVI